MTPEQFVNNVNKWSTDRQLFVNSSKEAQWYKVISELGELADAIVEDDRDAQRDAIGDTLVCLVNIALFDSNITTICFHLENYENSSIGGVLINMQIALLNFHRAIENPAYLFNTMRAVARLSSPLGFTLGECLAKAWHEIKDRKGHFSPSGAFVKE